ncbi:hypothetical protein [Mycobacteroides abscessus]|uniref:hypothetical protein n=1 Tax=Mycobacteroides abscessus TaxID=36809 RepID=UPI000928A960|nr:hypothetical protein [Mycobacteroides abscessus]MBN7379318.1 hypothetical protein [Mycobacteroides abscessus subsp. massiliense]MDO2972723.1 hypothetical protein [Mycobacteroides abscessus subsp. bolletii]MDO3081004.1 hypothetical protein [Mycobacteroides abscessus subsp. bolletii]SIK15132.1 Uncharacterised protein [Mycobacteroides abscessus subsp. abscessus]SIL13943.1 Uncharacterised protein [Mycobacteroides abscessus subsp. abscessus]
MTVINIDPRVRALIGLSAVAAWVKAPSNDELAAAVLEVVNEPTTEDGIQYSMPDLIAGLEATIELANRIREQLQTNDSA